jgi:hypothetical protein
MDMEFERLAYDSALRALDKQEAQIDELRARTGILLAASALAASFLGDTALGDANGALAGIALAAFALSIGSSVFILVPRTAQFLFSLSGANLYAELSGIKDDLPEVYRRLSYDLERFWNMNDAALRPMLRAFRLGAAGLVVEILAFIVLAGDTIV